MRKEYNKLIRDRIPEIISQDGRDYKVVTMSEDEHRLELVTKLVEEAKEALEVASDPGPLDRQSLIRELADLYEILDAIHAAFDLDRDQVLATQTHRRQERGAFEKRLRLLWVE